MIGHRLQWPINDDVGAIRDRIDAFASGAGIAGSRLHDLVFAANEAVVNVLEHGEGQGEVTVWRDGRQVVVEVVDRAGRLSPSHLSAVRPPLSGGHGFGLWLMKQVCDEFSIEQGADGSRVEMRMTIGDDAAERGRPPAKGPRKRFTVTVEEHPAGILLRASGELDALTTPELQTILSDLTAAGHRRIALDLAGVGFCDSSGLRTLLVSSVAADSASGLLVLTGVGGPLLRLLELTGSLGVLHVSPDLEDALARLAHRPG